MPFVPKDSHTARQAGLPDKTGISLYDADKSSPMVGNLQGQVRLNGGATSPFTNKTNVMGTNVGQGTKKDTRAMGNAPAATGVSLNVAAPKKRAVVSPTTAAAQHLASRRWGSPK